MQRLSCSSSLLSETSSNSSESPDKISSSPSLSVVGHSPDSWSSPRCSTSTLSDTLFLRSFVRLSMSSGILSTSDRTASLFFGSLAFIEFPPCVFSSLFIMVTSSPSFPLFETTVLSLASFSSSLLKSRPNVFFPVSISPRS